MFSGPVTARQICDITIMHCHDGLSLNAQCIEFQLSYCGENPFFIYIFTVLLCSLLLCLASASLKCVKVCKYAQQIHDESFPRLLSFLSKRLSTTACWHYFKPNQFWTELPPLPLALSSSPLSLSLPSVKRSLSLGEFLIFIGAMKGISWHFFFHVPLTLVRQLLSALCRM